PAGLAPEISAYPLFVYQNPDARPYFRLVSTLPRDPVASGLGRDDPVAPLDKTRPAAALARFEYGRLDFECQGDRDGVLVVADAWHPFWKAYVDGRETEVLKADEVFKAVAVPAGRHAVEMIFDTSPYWPGVYVSIAAWLVFGLAWLRLSRKKRSGP
ncbi:MAG: hypothetical protein PHV85_07350, partial [Desulfovibrionaceae bacterium]|nr:hypothetical protein [Desulfovibrionaceae bacterium]